MTNTSFEAMVGQPVFTQDGEQIGEVKEVRGRYFKVDVPMAPDYWLSTDAVRSASGGQVTLSVDKGRLGDFRVDRPDADAETTTTTTSTQQGTYATSTTGSTPMTSTGAGASGHHTHATETTTGGGWTDVSPTYRQRWEQQYGTSGGRWEDAEPGYRYGYEMSQDERYRGRPFSEVESNLRSDYSTWAQRQGYRDTEGGWDRIRNSVRDTWEGTFGDERSRATGTTATREGQDRIHLHEEELRARKETVEAGQVGIRKEVVAEEKTIEVPVTREEVVIERHPVDRRPSEHPIEAEADQTVRVPVREERVQTEKETVVTEEIEVGKRAVQETARVSDTVRREEARVETRGDVDVRGSGETRRSDTESHEHPAGDTPHDHTDGGTRRRT